MKIHHVSRIENTSFNPVPATPCSTRQSHLRPVHRKLTYSPSDDNDTSEGEVSSPHSMPQIQYLTPDTRSSPSKHTLATYEHLGEEADEEEDFQTVPWMINIGILKRFLTDHCAYMNIHYHMDYAHTHVHMWITRLHPT